MRGPLRAACRWIAQRAVLVLIAVVLGLSAAQAQDVRAPVQPEALPEPRAEVTPPDAATLAAVSSAARGPDIPDIDMADWEQLALRAERALDGGQLSNESFEILRALLAEYRAQFLSAQDLNAGRIETLRTQIAALGTPTEGVEEVPSVQARRLALEEQLATLRAPVIAADEAYTRANGLIIEIDQVIRTRQAQRLTEIGPSPVNPVLWAPALREMGLAFARLQREVTFALDNDVRRSVIYRSAPATGVLLLLGFVLLFRGRRWAMHADRWALRRGERGARVASSLLALGQILLPILGIWALVSAVQTLQILGTRGILLLDEVLGWAMIILGSRWLADRLFSQHDNARLLPMASLNRREARAYASALALLVVLNGFLQELSALNGFSSETDIVLGFPGLVLSALVLFRLGHLLAKKVTFYADEAATPGAEDQAERPAPMRARFVSILGRSARVIAIVSPILAAVGYGEAARALLYPAIATLGLSGLLIVLQRFTSEFYRYLARQTDDEDDSLVAVLIGFFLVIAALPLLALIWGARVADLTELWTRFGEGFTIGDARFQPTDFLVFLLVFMVFYFATRLIQAALRNTVLPKTSLDTGGRNAVVSGVGYIGIALAAILSISATGIDLSALAFIFTALSVGIGFGLQNIVQNFVSGIILLIERPIAEGDWIEVGGNMGYVRNISVRSTRIETFDRTDVIVPNGDLISGTVTNYTRGNSIGRVIVPVGVAYGTDVRLVESILINIARAHDMVLMNPPPSVIFQGFGADSLDFEIRAILRDVNYVLSVKSEMNHQIYQRFAEEGIEIPFAQRDVWLRNPEALAGAVEKSAETAEEAAAPQATGPQSPRVSDRDLGELDTARNDEDGDAR